MSRFVTLVLIFFGSFLSPASAQYSYDPNNPDEQIPGVVFFGSAKSQAGDRLSNVRVLIAAGAIIFDMLTDDAGRFRQFVSPEFASSDWRVICSKEGFVMHRLTKRPGPVGSRPSFQIDCILRPQGAP